MDLQTYHHWFSRSNELSRTKQHQQLKDSISCATSFLPPEAKLTQRLWHLSNNVLHICVCKVCSTPTRWNPAAKTYSIYCSTSCSSKDPEKVEASLSGRIAKRTMFYESGTAVRPDT